MFQYETVYSDKLQQHQLRAAWYSILQQKLSQLSYRVYILELERTQIWFVQQVLRQIVKAECFTVHAGVV